MTAEITAEELAAQIAGEAGRPEYSISLHLFCDRFLAATRAYAALQAQPTEAAQCCMCGKTGLSTVEGDGGPECELWDGRWVCGPACYSRACGEQPTKAPKAWRYRSADNWVTYDPAVADQWEKEGYMVRAEKVEPTEAPGRVRCWMSLTGIVTEDPVIGKDWKKYGVLKAAGHFIPDTDAHE